MARDNVYRHHRTERRVPAAVARESVIRSSATVTGSTLLSSLTYNAHTHTRARKHTTHTHPQTRAHADPPTHRDSHTRKLCTRAHSPNVPDTREPDVYRAPPSSDDQTARRVRRQRVKNLVPRHSAVLRRSVSVRCSSLVVVVVTITISL